MAKKTLVAFDFDNTLVDEDTDMYVTKLIPGGSIPQDILKLYR